MVLADFIPFLSDKLLDGFRETSISLSGIQPISVGTTMGEGEEISTFEKMPRPSTPSQFAAWLVPARNNIQREMLRLRWLLGIPPIVGMPMWVFRSRRLVLGASFSLWRSVFQARRFPMDVDVSKDGQNFLNEIIHNNAATYTTELNAWSLEYYIENAVYRLKHARELAIEGGVDASSLPEAHMLGESDRDASGELLVSTPFSPYGEWEECFLATRALISAMTDAVNAAREAHR